MTTAAKSPSPRASRLTNTTPRAPDPAITSTTNVTFTLSGTTPSWVFDNNSQSCSHEITQITYKLKSESTSGWGLSAIQIGSADAITIDNYSTNGYLRVTDQAQYWVTSFSTSEIKLVVNNNDNSGGTVGITLTVYNSSATPNSYSQDPQIVLEPRN